MEERTILKELMTGSHYAVYATVNEDGSPHNSPLFFMPSANLEKVYISTHPDSLHAQNIQRTQQAFAVIVQQTDQGGRGLYFKIENLHQVDVDNDVELAEALDAHNSARARLGKQAIQADYYQAPNPQRMYVGDIVEVTTNGAERDERGRIIRDMRLPVSIKDLIG